MKALLERLDDILIDAGTRTEANPDGDWSSMRFCLLITLATFLGLSIEDSGFRDAGAFVTVIIVLVAAVVGPKVFDLRVGIGQALANAAASIGRKFTRKEAVTVTQTEEAAPLPPNGGDDMANALDGVDPPPMAREDQV